MLTDRTHLLNFLIQQRNARRYLEISMHADRESFAQIHCARKKKIEASGPHLSAATKFFNQTRDKFDVVFIDGVHTEEQVLLDARWAFACLAPNGIIVLHDCMPPDAWHQREQDAYREGENWNGTAWKAALRIFNHTKYRCTLVDTDWGCGVIDTGQRQQRKKLRLPASLEYDMHYPWLLEYRKTWAAYLREWVQVFYHLACMGNWQQVFEEQMVQLGQNGFYHINLTVLGTSEEVGTAIRICRRSSVEPTLVFQAEELDQFERPTLLAIEAYAKENGGYVLYLHSKGVSNPADTTKTKWRRLMMRELVEKWESCLLQLPCYDVTGVNWREMPPTSHFCGNFWYASTRYLRKLADFTHYYDHPRYQFWDRIEYKRLGCEFWISSGREAPNVLSLYCRNVDFCNHAYWKDK
ncbi:MAG: class I SAM-dependent methyltransferase [Williamsia sp.]|nr:class I SAM-dependent methyltransferase [Williamsia sp.]